MVIDFNEKFTLCGEILSKNPNSFKSRPITNLDNS